MPTSKPAVSLTSQVFVRYCLLVILFIGLIFVLPPNIKTMQSHDLSSLQYRILYLTIAVPSLLGWLAAFIGYAKMHEYAASISDTPEAVGFRRLAVGSTWLAWSLPLTAITTLILNSLALSHPGFHVAAVIITNYVNLLLPLIALTIIATATRTLASTAKYKFSKATAYSIITAFVVAGLVYCYVTFQRFDLSSFSSTANPYYLPIWLMVITVIIPYLYAWFVGLLAAFEIHVFSKNVQGVLYRQALTLLVGGLIAVVISSIALQYINSASPRTGSLVINYKLLISTSFRVLAGAGYVAIAIGAGRLKKIEEV